VIRPESPRAHRPGRAAGSDRLAAGTYASAGGSERDDIRGAVLAEAQVAIGRRDDIYLAREHLIQEQRVQSHRARPRHGIGNQRVMWLGVGASNGVFEGSVLGKPEHFGRRAQWVGAPVIAVWSMIGLCHEPTPNRSTVNGQPLAEPV